MTRLTDVDSLYMVLVKMHDFGELTAKKAIRVVKNAPTVDAVPVIRCYECKYFKEFEKGFSSDWDGSCRYWNTHSTVYSNFCGCAARMDEDERD